MAIYKVWIEENLSKEIDIEADSMEEAEEIAIEKYNNCEIVLDDVVPYQRNIMIEDPEGIQTSWNEF